MGVQVGDRSQTEIDRDIKLSGFVDLIRVDVIGHVKNPSYPKKRTIMDQK